MIYVTRNHFPFYFFIMACIVSIILVSDIIYGYTHKYDKTPDDSIIFKELWFLSSAQRQSTRNQLLKQDSANEKVKIRLYYESLCPYSILFHTEDFNTTVNELASYLDFRTYPYGNARTKIDKKGKKTIECQHGPDECYGNTLHACAIDALGMTTSAIIYNSCMMSTSQSNGRSDDTSADKCGKLLGVDSEAIKACAKGDKGIKLLKYYRKETLKAKKTIIGVPYVLLNGKQFDTDNNFKKAVCNAFENPPKACQQNVERI